MSQIRQILTALTRFNIRTATGTYTIRRPYASGNPNQTEEYTNSVLERIRKELADDKKTLQWRKPISERADEWNSNLKVFADETQNSDYIVMMQQPMSMTPKSMMDWWRKRKANTERHLQQFVPERHSILGSDLAAAHFILYRGGAVRFLSHPKWKRVTKDGDINLPTKFHPQFKIEALRCDNMNLYYEGLENLRCLDYLKFLSYHNVRTFDDWCLDRVSGSQYPKLEVLDISGTKCTHNGLACLYRLSTLKLLIVDNIQRSLAFELSCAMLEQAIPNIKIVDAETVHNL